MFCFYSFILFYRTLQNEETGIDISVPRSQEEEAPLGGVSILYEISVLTSLELFKSRLHRNEDVVQFSVSSFFNIKNVS